MYRIHVSHLVAVWYTCRRCLTKGFCLEITSGYEISSCALRVCTLVMVAAVRFALQWQDWGSLDLELPDSCSHNFNGLRHGFDLGLTCMVNYLSAHFSISSLWCLSVSIFFLILQLLLYPLLQSSYNPVVLILQAVAMEIMVISRFKCCKHCRRQCKRWLARVTARMWGDSSEELFLNLFFRGVLPLLYCVFSVCTCILFFSAFVFFCNVIFLLKVDAYQFHVFLRFCEGYYKIMSSE